MTSVLMATHTKVVIFFDHLVTRHDTFFLSFYSGLIKYYTQPPVATKTEVGSALVSELGQEFDLDSLASEEGSMMKALPTFRPSQTMVVESLGPVVEVRETENMENEDSNDEMDDASEDEEEQQLVGY